MPESHSLYADLIMPLPVAGTFTFEVPDLFSQTIKPGMRAVVQFGSKKLYTAIVASVHSSTPKDYQAKPILDIPDRNPVVYQLQIDFWNWISTYYLCSLGEVSKAALPAGMRLESETRLFAVPSFDPGELDPAFEKKLWNHILSNPSCLLEELSEQFPKTSLYKSIKNLIEKGAVSVNEKLQAGFKPKLKTCYRPSTDWLDAERATELQKMLSRSPKQLATMDWIMEWFRNNSRDISGGIPKDVLLESAGTGVQIISSLVDRGLLEQFYETESRLQTHDITTEPPAELSLHQQNALDDTLQQFESKDVVLMQGVTSSGKTEVYIHLIRKYLEEGKQVLYLLPEIALTTQIIRRLRRIFGNKVGVYHSKFPDNERVEIWNNLLENDSEKGFQLILGVRSSIFLPFRNLGLIIVDEEHENTFKQYDPAPRYHARDASIVLAQLHQAKVLLGTATPSMESWLNHDLGKFGLVRLTQRFGNIKMPEIRIVDINIETKKKAMHSHFSSILLKEMENALNQQEQIILFQNRRGFAPILQCGNCGWIPVCKTCDVSLTWHKFKNQLVCHYCGTAYTNIRSCKSCQHPEMKTIGFGTEKIEDEISLIFPTAGIARLDLDTARSRKAYETIISNFETGKTQILIGTQMVSKGLDFDKVGIVGILNADSLLNFPDFRAFERSFQLMEQVSGRAGRKEKQGKVIIQTRQPEHRILKNIVHHDFLAMYRKEILERRIFNYPPFTRLIRITVKHRDAGVTEMAAIRLASLLKESFGPAVTGPDAPIVGRIQNLFLRNILLKFERDKQSSAKKTELSSLLQSFKSQPENKSLSIQVDVDAM